MNPDQFLVVGLGASAGGIKALKKFFAKVPSDSGMAYVVILHLSPEHESHLAEVLQIAASIPVTQVKARVHVAPDHVYVIPPNRTLSMRDDHLSLTEMTHQEQRRSPVDSFFRTLAESHESRAVCVVLSGTGANGSNGVKHVKAHGGLCLVQDPEEAQYADMPRNAIATTAVDQVLPVAAIPRRILAYRDSLESVRVPAEPAEQPAAERALGTIFGQMRTRTGHDFASYKRGTVLRRIARRMRVHEVADLPAYASLMRDTPDEAPALLKDLLISVTSFFRDADTFGALARTVIPTLFEGKGEDDPVRIWVPGCATGEEAYSIAILLAEHAATLPAAPSMQIFATDIDGAAIDVARAGLYTAADIGDLSPDRLRRFFIADGLRYRVRKELREMLLFTEHNLLRDPPFAHLDLASCRNLFIYFNRAAQLRLLEVLHFALQPGGFLFLGNAESIEGATDLFAAVEPESHVFQSRAVPPRIGPPISEVLIGTRGMKRGRIDTLDERLQSRRYSLPELHQRLLEAYAPPSLMINEEHEIVHLSERAGRYLQFAPGEPSHNLLKAVRPELRLELRAAIAQAARERSSVDTRNLSVRLDEGVVSVNLLVRPVLGDGDTARGFFLVLFEEDRAGASPTPSATPLNRDDSARRLEGEVVHVRTQLRATIERHEAQAEELTASNEELLAMNEELRSATEELETSREELQSLNEELQTVNQELKIKVDEQSAAADDILNLINSAELGTIFLDRTSRIKLFTPRVRDIFNLIPSDLGRPLSDISNRLVDAQVPAVIARVVERLERVEREVQSADGRWFLMRVIPYRTTQDRIDGIVLTFLDITSLKQSQEELRRSENHLRLMIESVTDYGIFTTDARGVVNTWNAGAARMFGYTDEEIIGQPAAILFTEEDRARGAHDDDMRQSRETGRAAAERWHVRKDGSRMWIIGTTSALRDRGYVTIARDLTERKYWEDTLQRQRDELELRIGVRTYDLEAANRTLDLEVRERREAEARVRALLARLITAQEDERRRIGRDLHDHLGQQLTGLQLKLDSLSEWAGNDARARAALGQMQETVSRFDRELDFLASELRPAALDDLGLPATLANFVREWSKNFGVHTEFHTAGLQTQRLGFDIETHLYRIAQEALNNVFKHSAATRAGVILERRDGDVVLIVEDNGKGFDVQDGPTTAGMGLIGMRERAALAGGRFEIETAPDRGTTIFVHVPYPVDTRLSV